MKLVDGLIIYEKGDKIIVNANAEKFSHTPVAGAQGVGWMKQMDEMLEKQYTLERSGNNGEFEIGRFTFNSYMVRPFYDVPLMQKIVVGNGKYEATCIKGKDIFSVGCQTITKEQFEKVRKAMGW